MKMLRTCLASAAAAGLLLLSIQQAGAHASPAGCGGAGVGVQIFKFRLNGSIANSITNGEPVIYTVQVQNNAQLPTPGGLVPVCDVTCASVFLRCPDVNGNPGAPIILATNLNLPFGTPPLVVGSVTCIVSVASGVGSAKARAEVVGVVHDLSIPGCTPNATCVTNQCDPDIGGGEQEVSVTVFRPCINVTKQCLSAVAIGPNAVRVTFSGSVSNCGDETLINVSVVNNQPAPGTVITNINSLPAGGVVTFGGTYTNTSNICGPFPDTVTATGTGLGSGGVVTSSASAQCTIVYTPCIAVTKNCSTNLLFLCASNPAPITFSGIISNCGNIALTNVVVRDNLAGTLAGQGAVVLTLPSLAVGATANWSTNMTIGGAFCGRSNIANTVTAVGANACNPAQSVTNQATCTFTVVCPQPSLTVTKGCASPIVTNVGSSLTVTGQVCNTGTIPFSNVIVVDQQPGIPVSATNNLGELAPGQCKPFSFTYTATTCSNNVDTVTATGVSLCGNVSASASATCRLCCPAIAIEKLVACVEPGGSCPAAPAAYAPSATGVRGNTGDPALDNPAFCYLIRVRNTGQDPLVNLVVNDNRLGFLGSFPGPLAPGNTIVISGLKTNWATTTTNTVTVTAQCGGVNANAASVSATTNAVAVVVPANIICVKLASVNGGAPVQTFNASDCTSATNVVIWYAAATNTGSAALTNVTITELGTGPDLLPCGPVNRVYVGVLQPGQGTGLIPLCTNTYGCVDTNIDNSIRVRASVLPTPNTCALNTSGTNITVTSECRASVTLCCQPPGLGCRVTGGGRQDEPDVCPDNVRYVTHGGQVGAPVGNSNCVVTLDNIIGNPCIHGRWTHVRHQQGGLEGNFHARYYDTLQCACLGLELSAAGLWSDGTTEDGSCNPDDKKIAGPQPRRAPANKIVFTGVGDWADPNGRREPRSVLFRVDIEDRSEPGGYHPGGAQDPPDRYRIRIWVLTQAELARLNNPADGLLDFRNDIAACNGLKYRDGVNASQLENACGNPQATITFPGGDPVRQPDIDDGGALKNGNHQIHPQIKDCP